MPIHDVHTQCDVMVPMRDGLHLAADVYLPAADGKPLPGPFPAILERTPYGKSIPVRLEQARYFGSRGYAVILQDCRGRYSSEGSFVKYVKDGPDGYDTVEWIGKQLWCNGKVGTFGISYGAHTQAALACFAPPSLACMFLDSGAFSNAYKSGCRNGGAFELRQVTWAFREALASKEAQADPVVRAALERQDIEDWFHRFPWEKGMSPLRWTPDYEEYLWEIWTSEVYNNYWRQVGLCLEEHYDAFSDVPQVHFGSWYDPYARTTCDNYTALSRLKKGPVALIMGPWTHGAHSVSDAGDIDLGQEAPVDGNLAQDYNELRLRFFDRWLKNVKGAIDSEPPVKIFVMGGGTGSRNTQGQLDHGGRWRSETEWPPARVQHVSYYLHLGGGLGPAAPESQHPPTHYTFDPQFPVPTIGGNISSGAPIMQGGGFHQQERPDFYGSRAPYLPLSSRQDVLVFQTPPLKEALEVTGPISVRLWVSSSAVDTDFTAKLLDVYPPSHDYPEGFDLNLTDGIIRGRFRDSWTKPELMEPDQVYPVTIELFPISNLFVPGHRIRLDVSSSNFPRFDVNPNTGNNPVLPGVRMVAHNAVYHDADHPSHMVLPTVPAEAITP